MKFIVNSQSLLKQLQALSSVLANNNTMPIINCIHFHLEEGNLTLKATDLSNTLVARMQVETAAMDSPEEVAVPSRMLLDIVKSFADVPLTFSTETGSTIITISSGEGKYQIAGMDASTYPNLPTAEGTDVVVMSSDTLVKAINKTSFATSTDEMQQQLSGILCEMTPDNITFVATDAHKLVRYRNNSVKSNDAASFIIPRKPITIVKNILAARKEECEISIEYNATNLFITFDNFYIACRLLDGRYPNYDAAIPKDNPYRMIIDRQSLLNTLRRVSIFASQATHQVRLSITNSKLEVSAEDLEFSNNAHESIPCQFEGDNMEIGFNAKFLTEMLNNLDTTNILMELSHPSRAGIIYPYTEGEEQNSNDDILMLVMPVMLAN